MGRKVTFDTANDPDVINFGVGQPSDDLLPVEMIHRASEACFSQVAPRDLNYGERQGDVRFRDALSGFLTDGYGHSVSAEELIVTGGNSQSLDFVCGLFTRPGDTVLVEEPSYFLAFQIFRDHGLNIVSAPVDEDGLCIDAVERLLQQYSVRLLYTIPSFHNPGGQSLSLDRRKRLVELSRQHDFIIAADEVYQLLYFDKPPPPALGTMTADGNVLSLGSFSKITAPGLRLGWVQTSGHLLEALIDSGAINSGGSLNHFTSQIVRHAIELGLQDEWLGHLRRSYQSRASVMHESLRKTVGDRARWHRPEGGYFFWLEFEPGTDTSEWRQHAGEFRTGFQPGVNFSPKGDLNHCLRLSFAHYNEAEIAEGVRRLGDLLDRHA